MYWLDHVVMIDQYGGPLVVINYGQFQRAFVRLLSTPKLRGLAANVLLPFSQPSGVSSLLGKRRPFYEELKYFHAVKDQFSEGKKNNGCGQAKRRCWIGKRGWEGLGRRSVPGVRSVIGGRDIKRDAAAAIDGYRGLDV